MMQRNKSSYLIARLFVQMSGALAFLHKHDTVHKDISPKNFLIVKDYHIVSKLFQQLATPLYI